MGKRQHSGQKATLTEGVQFSRDRTFGPDRQRSCGDTQANQDGSGQPPWSIKEKHWI